MVIIRFSVFEEKVKNGEKKQTIRPCQNYRRLKVADAVHCYSTERRAGTRPVTKELLYRGICIQNKETTWGAIKNNEDIAWLDGFLSAKEMRQWFEKQYPRLHDTSCFRIIQWISK